MSSPGDGYGRACAGAAAARDAVIVFLDGDGSDCPELLPRLVAPIAPARMISSSPPAPEAAAAGCMYWHQSRRPDHRRRGMAALRRPLYRHVRLPRHPPRRADRLGMREMTYGWNLEMQMKAARAGLRILELPVPYALRAGGASKVAGSFRGSIRAAWHISLTITRIAIASRTALASGTNRG